MKTKGFLFLIFSVIIIASIGFYIDKNSDFYQFNSEDIPYYSYVNYERKFQPVEDTKVFLTVMGNQGNELTFKVIDSQGNIIFEDTTDKVKKALEVEKGLYTFTVHGDVDQEVKLNIKIGYFGSQVNFESKD
ncbi:MAG: hypothetical protein ACQESN_04660 [Thermotogota bacterium]